MGAFIDAALRGELTEAFEGVLITDFWAAYGSVPARHRQYGIVHLLGELKKVDQAGTSAEWRRFAKHFRRLLRDGLGLRRRLDLNPGLDRYAIVTSTNANYDDWACLTKEQYDAAKADLIETTIRSLEKYLPDVRTKIDHVEASTPRTSSSTLSKWPAPPSAPNSKACK